MFVVMQSELLNVRAKLNWISFFSSIVFDIISDHRISGRIAAKQVSEFHKIFLNIVN